MTISRRVQHNMDGIKMLAMCDDPKLLRKMIMNASDELIACLVECISKVLDKKVYISKPRKKKLSKHVKAIRKLGKTRSKTKARKILVQEGGGFFLPLLLGPVLTAATSLIADLILK